MKSFNALDLNGFVFAVAKMVDNNVRQSFLKVSSGLFMIRTTGYDAPEKYQRHISKEGFQQLNDLFVWNRTFLCWALKEDHINGQKLVDIMYHLASAANGKLEQVEVLKNMGDILIGARGMFEESDYAHVLKTGKLYERIKSVLTWETNKNAWSIPCDGKTDASVMIMKYKPKSVQGTFL